VASVGVLASVANWGSMWVAPVMAALDVTGESAARCRHIRRCRLHRLCHRLYRRHHVSRRHRHIPRAPPVHRPCSPLPLSCSAHPLVEPSRTSASTASATLARSVNPCRIMSLSSHAIAWATLGNIVHHGARLQSTAYIATVRAVQCARLHLRHHRLQRRQLVLQSYRHL